MFCSNPKALVLGLVVILANLSFSARGASQVENASAFSGSNAGTQIAAAMAHLPSTGGTVVADYKSPQTISRDIFSGVTKPVHLILSGTTFNVGADMAVPRNVSLEFEHGAQLALAHPLDIGGRIIAPASQQIFTPVGTKMVRFSGGGTATPTQTSSTPPETYLYPQWWGAVGDGATDDTAAFVSALAAMEGVAYWNPPFYNTCLSLFLPTGQYLISVPQTIHLVVQHSGCGILGTGPYASVIKYTNNTASSGNYLIYHDEPSGDGPLENFFIRDVGFVGPGVGSNASWFWDAGGPPPGGTDFGTAGLLIQNVYIQNFYEGFRIGGTAATENGTFRKFGARNVTNTFHANNEQSSGYELIDADICAPPSGGDVFVFDTNADLNWTIVGGYLCTLGPNDNIFHILSTFTGNQTGGNLSIMGTHIDLLGGSNDESQLVRDDSLGSSKSITFVNVSAGNVDDLPRQTITVVGRSVLEWKGGLLAGWVTMNTDVSEFNGDGAMTAPPLLSVEDAQWNQGNNAYTAPVEQNCTGSNPPYTCTPISSGPTTPIIYYRNVLVIGAGYIADQDTNPLAKH
jgi:hypothetical protein